ncbi:MAG TPA: site-specific integrase [Steroidobacter sp.]
MQQSVRAPAGLARACVSTSGAPETDSADDWSGLSEDLIGRFLDVLAVKFRYSRATRAAHRTELHRADRWMQQRRSRTLVAASKCDMRAYVMERRSNGVSAAALSASLRHLRRFYAFLLESHARADDPLADLVDISPALHAGR